MKLFTKIAMIITIIAMSIIAIAAFIIGRAFTSFIAFAAILLALLVAFSD